MIGKNNQMTPKPIRKESSAEKAFANTDILLTIVEFIPDNDLLSFLLIKKSAHSILTKSKLIEIRMLRFELKNAEQTLQDLQIDYPTLKHKKKKREQNSTILNYTSPNIPVVNIQGLTQPNITKNLVYNILFGPKIFTPPPMQSISQPPMSSFEHLETPITHVPRFDLANCTDFEDYANQRNSNQKSFVDDSIENSFEYPTGKIDNSYTRALTETSFKLEVRKTQLKMMIQDYISNPTLPELKETHSELKGSTTKAFCPAMLVQNLVSNMKNITNYIYPNLSSLSSSSSQS